MVDINKLKELTGCGTITARKLFQDKEIVNDWKRLAQHLEVMAASADYVAKCYEEDYDNVENAIEDFLDVKNTCIKFMEENDFCDFRL